MDSLVSHGYCSRSINADDQSVVDSSTVAAKKGGRRLAMTATRESREARYTQ
jgi:hypothetical protein